MIKHKEYSIIFPDNPDTRMHVRIERDKNKIVFFCINLVLLKDDKTFDVYRVDNAHGFVHEQRFWKSPKKIKLNMDCKAAIKEKRDEIIENRKKWAILYKKANKMN